MPEDHPWDLVPFEPDTETVQRVGWILSIVLFLLAILSAAGELLGWWSDLGEVGMTVGTLGGLFVAFATLVLGADSAEVRAVHQAVSDNGDKLERLHPIDRKLERLEKLEELDRVQYELDKQTGVLEDIRDLL